MGDPTGRFNAAPRNALSFTTSVDEEMWFGQRKINNLGGVPFRHG
jgi:hypothetical protein